MEDAANEQMSLLARIAAADPQDLAPMVGSSHAAVPIVIGGKKYNGIAAVPLNDLVMCSAADHQAMKPAQRSHMSRRLMAAAKDGTLSPAEVEALQAIGRLPEALGEEPS